MIKDSDEMVVDNHEFAGRPGVASNRQSRNQCSCAAIHVFFW